jgi:hypothetical protein
MSLSDDLGELLSSQDPILPDIPEWSVIWDITHEEYLILSKALEIRIRGSKIVDPAMASEITYHTQIALLKSRKDWHVQGRNIFSIWYRQHPLVLSPRSIVAVGIAVAAFTAICVFFFSQSLMIYPS